MTTPKRKSIAVDFDGVLHNYIGDWQGHHIIEGKPIEGAIRWLHDMVQHYNVFILTTRGETWRGRRAVRAWLKENCTSWEWEGVPEDEWGLRSIRVTNRKLPALIYLDDRAVRFDGTTAGSFPTPNEVESAQPWWRTQVMP